jgi:hypothetical protein
VIDKKIDRAQYEIMEDIRLKKKTKSRGIKYKRKEGYNVSKYSSLDIIVLIVA